MERVLLVEGKYDAARLANLVEGAILTTDGFRVYKDKALQALLKRMAAKRGLVLLTDPDAAGFRIRRYVAGLVGREHVCEAYVPAVAGKEARKPKAGAEGLLGVEGLADEAILAALEQAGAFTPQDGEKRAASTVAWADLFDWGLSGTAQAAERRRRFAALLGLPPRLSKTELVQVLAALYTREELEAAAQRARGE